jgi:hypothetical protein
MTKLLSLLVLHVLLLVLASTGFTAVTGIRDGHYRWEYFRYLSESGWGVPYQVAYSLQVVLTYLVGYAIGATAYRIVYRSGSPVIGLTGLVLCGVGFISYAFELSHWFVDHNRSWIASAPIALFALAPVAAIRQYWGRPQEPDGHSSSHEPSSLIN